MGDIIKVEGLKKIYNKQVVLNIPTITINQSDSFGLVGNNGAGKTTFFRLILDLIRADGGRVLSKGKDVAENEGWKHYTGSYLDEGFLIDYLTPEEYFNLVGTLNGLSKGDVEQFLSRFKDFFNNEILSKKKYIRELSKGDQKKLGLAAAIMIEPEILILDEPFSNLDPSSQYLLKKILKELQQNKNTTMIISSHDLNHVTEVCQRIVVLHEGEVVHDLQTNENTLKKLEAYFAVKGD